MLKGFNITGLGTTRVSVSVQTSDLHVNIAVPIKGTFSWVGHEIMKV